MINEKQLIAHFGRNYNYVVLRGAVELALDLGSAKGRTDLRSHGINFEAVIYVFDDPLAATREDPYPYEQRWRTIGMVGTQVLMVVHTWPDFDVETGEEVGRDGALRRATVAVIWRGAVTVWRPDALLGCPCNVAWCCVAGGGTSYGGAAAVDGWPGLCLGDPAGAPRLGVAVASVGRCVRLESKRRSGAVWCGFGRRDAAGGSVVSLVLLLVLSRVSPRRAPCVLVGGRVYGLMRAA